MFLVGATTSAELRLKDEILDKINRKEDSVIICDLGKYDERESKCSYLGKHVESGLDRECMII